VREGGGALKARRLDLLRLILVALLLAPWPAEAQEGEVNEIPTEDVVTESGQSEAAEDEAEDDESADGESDEDDADEDEDEEEEEPDPRITFRVPFSDEKGGGIATGSAGFIEQRPDSVVASEGVQIKFRNLKINAERIEVESETKRVLATGNVVVDQGPKRLSAERVEFDLETETGTFYEAKAFVDPDIYFIGEEIIKTGENSYDVKRGMFTSCEDDVPEWSFRVASASIDLGGYARARHTSMRVKKLPMLYFPYILWPAKQDRVSGFLVPNVGHSQRRGAHLGLAYFQTLGRSADTTFYADLYSEEFFGIGNEFRYRPSETTEGLFEGYAIEDPERDETRWKLAWNHESNDLPFGMRGVVNYLDYSDPDFFGDFERDFSSVTLRSLQSTGFLTGSWGQHSLTILANDSEEFLRNGSILKRRQLPEIEYRMFKTQVADLPLYFEFLGGAHQFEITLDDLDTVRYNRTDVFPQLTIPLSTLPWLSASVTAGARATFYEDSVDEDSIFTGESLDRFFTTVDGELVGPSFSKIIETPVSFFEKFKHIIEPRWSYRFVEEFEEQAFVPVFDEVDILRASNVVGFALVNRVLGKPKDLEEHGDVREIFSFEVGQAYSLDDDRPLQFSSDGMLTMQESPITARLRFNPSINLTVDGSVSYSTLFEDFSQTALSGTWNFGEDYQNTAGLTWTRRRDVEDARVENEQLSGGVGFDIIRDKLRWESGAKYNIKTSQLLNQQHNITYTGNCYGVRLEFVDIQTSRREDTQFRLAISLKNVGTFLDLTSGQKNSDFQ